LWLNRRNLQGSEIFLGLCCEKCRAPLLPGRFYRTMLAAITRPRTGAGMYCRIACLISFISKNNMGWVEHVGCYFAA
jgi:hypothetical protein